MISSIQSALLGKVDDGLFIKVLMGTYYKILPLMIVIDHDAISTKILLMYGFIFHQKAKLATTFKSHQVVQ